MVAISTAALLGASALSAAGGLAGNVISTKLSLSKAKELAAYQAALNYDYSQKAALNSPSWNRKGLEDAGYNPMLAVQNATSGVNSSWASPQDSSVPDMGNSFMQSMSNAMDYQRVQNETATADSTVKLNEANSRKLIADAIGQELKNPFIPQEEQNKLNNMSALTEKLIRETSFYDQLAENMEAERRLQELGIYMDYKGRMYTADTAYAGTVYNSDTMKNIADEHSPSGRSASFNNYAGGVSNILHGIGSVIHGYNETNNYSSGNESTTTYYDKNGNVRGSVSHSGRSSSRGTKTHRRK